MVLPVREMRRTAKRVRGKVWALRAAAAAVAFGGALQEASAQTWADPAAVQPQLTNAGGTTWTSTVALADGAAIKMEAPNGTTGLKQGDTYYVVGNGSTPSTMFKLVGAPGNTALASPSAAQTTGIPFVQATNWNVASNWGGTVPNAIDAVANFTSDTNTDVYTYSSGSILTSGPYGTVMLTQNTTVGAINFSATAGDLILQSGLTANTGPLAALTFATSTGSAPTVNVSGGKGLWFSDIQASGAGPTFGVPGTDMVIDGNQGLTITNSNTIGALPLPSSNGMSVGASATPGSVKFGYGIDWSGFSGTLTLAQGAFAPQAGGSAGQSALPMNNDIVLGTGSNTAQLELFGNQSQEYIRGLDGDAQSVVINSSTSGAPALTLGSFSQPGDSYTFAGDIGVPISTPQSSSIPSSLRIVKIGAGTQFLTGANVLYDPLSTAIAVLTINGGTLSLGTTGTIGAGTGALATNDAGTGSVSMHNGTFSMTGTSAAARTESFGSLAFSNGVTSSTNYGNTSNGQSTVYLTANSAQPTTLTFASLQARNGGAGNFNANGQTTLYEGSNLGMAPGNGVSSIFFTTAPTAVTGAIGTSNYNVLKGALALDTFNNVSGFATYDPTNGVRILGAGTYSNEQNTSGYPASSAATTNYRLNLTGGTTTVTNGVTTQTLQMDNTSGSPQTLTVNGTAINAGSGFLFSGTSGVTLNGTSTVTGTAATNGEDVVFLSSTASSVTANVAIPVTNTSGTNLPAWITYGGTGNFNITGTQTISGTGGLAFNSTGGTTLGGIITGAGSIAINQGSVGFGTGTSPSIAGTPDLLVAPGATFDFNGITAAGNAFNRIDSNAVFNPGNSTVVADYNGGGTITNSVLGSANTVTLTLSGTATTTGTFPGVIGGNLNLALARTGGGVQILSGVNTYTGSTTIYYGDTLLLGRYGQLPSGTSVTLGDSTSGTSGVLELGDTAANNDGAVNQTVASITSPSSTAPGSIIGGNVNVSVLTVNPSTADTYAGILGSATNGNGNNLQLHVIGTGSLILTNNNYYTGGTVINNGGLLSVASDNTTGAAAPLGTLYFPSTGATNPASPVVNNIVIDGGTLQVTASTTINPFRGIGIGQMTGSANSTGTISIGSGATVNYGGVIASAGNTGTNNLTKDGPGVLSLTGANSYNGVTTVTNGNLTLSDAATPTVLTGTTQVIVNATGATGSMGALTLISATSNPALISSTAEVFIKDPGATNTTPIVNLNFTGGPPSANADPNNPNAPIEVVFSLNIGNTSELPGYYGLNANNPDGDFTGAGELDVISQAPEPGTLWLLGLGGLTMMRRRRATATTSKA